MSSPSNKLPRRGPRVMHGAAAALANTARDLSYLRQKTAAGIMGSGEVAFGNKERDAMEALNELLTRLSVSEARVDKALRVIAAFREQCAKQPADSLAVQCVVPVLDTLEAALK